MSGSFSVVRDVLSAACMLGGALLAFAAAIGLYRFGTTRARMHATTKPATLGVLLCGLGAAIQFSDVSGVTKIGVVVVLQLVTSPIGAHMLGRAVGDD